MPTNQVLLQYTERNTGTNALQVNTSPRLELFHTYTYATAAGVASASIPVAERGGFRNGDVIYVGTNAASTISDGTLIAGVRGPGTIAIVTAISWSNNDPVILKRVSGGGADAYAPIYDDPDLQTEIGVANFPWTGDTNNEWEFYAEAGAFAQRFSTAAAGTLRMDGDVQWKEHDWQIANPNHNSETSGIQEAIDRLGGVAGTVYLLAATYTITDEIDVPANTRIIGAGKRLTTIVVAANAGGDTVINGAIFNLGNNTTNIEIAHLSIDGNQDDGGTNAANDNYQGIQGAGGNDDLYIHDVYITSVRLGVSVAGSLGNLDSLRVRIHHVEADDIGQEGIILRRVSDSEVAFCIVRDTGDTGITLSGESGLGNGTIRNFRNRIIGNHINRANAPTHIYSAIVLPGTATGIGFLAQIRHCEDTTVVGNVLWDNRLTYEGANTAGDDGWGGQAIDVNRSTIVGNVVGYAGAFGIDVGANCTCTNNVVYRPGTHGIVAATDALASDYQNLTVNYNIVIEPNEADVAATVDGYRFNMSSGAAGAGIDTVVLCGNILRDARGRAEHGATFGSAATMTIDNIITDNNDFGDATLSAFNWVGTPSTITNIRLGQGNITPSTDPYRGITYLTADGLVGGAAAGTRDVQNTRWPAIALVFVLSRTSRNAGGIGVLEGVYDGTDTLTLNALTTGAAPVVEATDKSAVYWACIGTAPAVVGS